jgi:hypothetical protein
MMEGQKCKWNYEIEMREFRVRCHEDDLAGNQNDDRMLDDI